MKGTEVLAVDDVSLSIEKGEVFGIIGFSGAGKSTLVRCINLLEVPTEGAVYFEDTNLLEVSGKQLRKYRQKMGMIFQQFNLLEQRNVLDNVCYPLEVAGAKKTEARKRALELLEIVGIADKAQSYPSQLSGGQKQRVAIARALTTNPEVLLCDEATSALDPLTTQAILQLIKEINRKMGVTVIVITHEMKVVEQVCDRVAVMKKGKVVEEGTVQEVFSSPKSETAKKLVMPGTHVKIQADRSAIRIVFDGRSSSEPILSDLVLACNAKLNVLGANTEDIGGTAYGQMLIEKPDGETLQKVVSYLEQNGITYEEVEVSEDE